MDAVKTVSLSAEANDVQNSSHTKKACTKACTLKGSIIVFKYKYICTWPHAWHTNKTFDCVNPLRTVTAYMHHGNNITIREQIAITLLLFTL